MIFPLCLSVLSCVLASNSAQGENLSGVWEAAESREWQEGRFHFSNYFHHVLKFGENGSYDYTILSEDPDNPLRTDSGLFRQIENQVVINADTLNWSEDGSILASQDLSLEFRQGRLFDGNIVGVWDILGLDGRPTGSTFSAFQDGTFEADIDTGWEKGWYVIAGSAMVHFPTETENPDLLGIPGLWTNVEIESNVLSYTIADSDLRISAMRILSSSVAFVSWANVKTSVAGYLHKNRRIP